MTMSIITPSPLISVASDTRVALPFDMIVFVGCHSSGKTTLGQHLSQILGWPFHDEIGRKLREQRLSVDKNAHAQCEQPDFDQAVYDQECTRDHSAPSQRIVETWHPGNLAYMQARSPALFSSVFPKIQKEIFSTGTRILVQPLQISLDTLRSRLSEPGPADVSFLQFLHNIGTASIAIAQALGLSVAPPISTDQHDVETCVQMILKPWGKKAIMTGM